ncbi:hypothetical protein LTR81_004091 [Elasticomyces elasticus]
MGRRSSCPICLNHTPLTIAAKGCPAPFRMPTPGQTLDNVLYVLYEKSLPQCLCKSDPPHFLTKEIDRAALKVTYENGCQTCSLLYRAIECYNDLDAEDFEQDGTFDNQIEETGIIILKSTVHLHVRPLMPRSAYWSAAPAHNLSCWPWSRHHASEESSQWIKATIEDCRHNQDNMHCRNTSVPKLPTRVIDVGKAKGQPKLIVSHEMSAEYIALSHCWGGDPQMKLTKATFAQYQNRLDLSAMPQTFKDAIHVAQQLQIRYAREAATMAGVYYQAYCVISATLAHGDDEGFLRPFPGRWPPRMIASDATSQILDTCVQARDENLISDPLDMPTHERAWCFQELLLAARIVSYEKTRILYHCSNGSLHDMHGPEEAIGIERMRQDIQAQMSRERYMNLEEWMNIVGDFTTRRLTVPSDRLPALSGVAKSVNAARQSSYLGGLWEADLPWNLLWYTTQPRHPDQLGYALQKSPSFAWCSVSSQVAQSGGLWSAWQSLVTISEVYCEPAGPNTYGQVSGGCLRLTGSVYTAELSWMPNNGWPAYWRMSAIHNLQAGKKPNHVWNVEGLDNRDIVSDVYLIAQQSAGNNAGLPHLRRSHIGDERNVIQATRATATLLLLARSGKQTLKEILSAGGKEERFVFLLLGPLKRPE